MLGEQPKKTDKNSSRQSRLSLQLFGFVIEKSYDGVTYHELAKVSAAGYSTDTKQYGYLDREATDINYYRLKMVDLDASSRISNVVIVKNPGLQQNISPIRNPFVDRIDIRFTKLPKGEISMRLVDVAGRTLATNKLVNPVSPVIRFNYNESLSSGVYFLQVAAEGKQYSLKLVKQ